MALRAIAKPGLENSKRNARMDAEPLSEAGQLRRQQILLLAQGQARRRRRARRNRRGGGFVVLGLIAAAVLWPRHHDRRNSSSPIARASPPASQPSSEPSGIVVQYIQTDPTIADRLTLGPQTPRWTSIDDRQLLDELAAAGQPGGIVSMNGKTMLLLRSTGQLAGQQAGQIR